MAFRREKSFGPLGKLFVKEEDDDIRRDEKRHISPRLFVEGYSISGIRVPRECSQKRKKKETEREREGVVYRALFEGLESKGFLMSRRDERKLWPDITISVSGGVGREEGAAGRRVDLESRGYGVCKYAPLRLV